jgi:hypothetical protein
MKEHFVTYEQALALKELGFNESCLLEEYFEDSQCVSEWAYEEPFKINTELDYLTDKFNADDDEHYEYSVAVPLKSQVFRWFREKHGLYSVIDGLEHRQYYKITQLNSCSKEYDTYEEAESACINKLIKIIKEKKS